MEMNRPLEEVEQWDLEEIFIANSLLTMKNDQHMAWRAYYEFKAGKESKKASKRR
jgi:hypothetical protein